MKYVIAVFLLVVIFGSNTGVVNGARILGIFHFPARSQHVLGSYLLKQLAARGHQVTMLSPFPFDKPVANYTDLKIDDGILDYMDKNSDLMNKVLRGEDMSILTKLSIIPNGFKDFGILFLDSPKFKEFMKSDVKFDLVIQLYMMNDAFLGIGHHFNAPTVAFCSIGASPMINYVFANPAPYSMVPTIFLPSTEKFFERVVNTLASFSFDRLIHNWLMPIQRDLLKKHFPNAPPLEDLIDNVNIALLNSHPAIEGSKPYMPNMIQIGGFHIAQTDPLPKEFQQFMDSAKDGVILFSLGSNVKTSAFPKERLINIVRILGQLKQKVIFKHDGVLENVPKNMLVSKWLPQTSVLAHKNMALFITHAGLGGIAEGIYNAVPMICIPFFGDQHKNAEDIIKRGMGVKMLITELDDDSLATYINEVITNPKYKKQTYAISDFYRSQPIDPLEKAIYWVEHVIKHKGASHFPKSIGTKQYLHQYLLLDVLGFIGAVLLTIFLVLYFVTRAICRLVCRKLGLCGNKSKADSKTSKSKKKN